MSIRINEDIIGGGGYPGAGWGGGGIFLIAILLIFLVMAGAWGSHGKGHGGGHEGACADMVTLNRFGNFMDPQLAKIETEVACRTGAIQTQNAVDTGAIVHILDNQTCQIKEGQAAIIANQQAIAREQEVMALNGKIADLRDCNLKLEGKLLQQETVNMINGGNCQLNHRLDRIECEMAKRPPFFSAGAYPTGIPYGAWFGGAGNNNNGCCA